MIKIVTFDIKEEGFRTVVKDYQEVALRYLWSLDGGGASSRDVWVNVNRDLMGKRTISRASIINFLNHMVDEGLLTYNEITGKGGHRRIYSAKYDEAGTKRYIAENIISKMLETWQEATRAAMNRLQS